MNTCRHFCAPFLRLSNSQYTPFSFQIFLSLSFVYKWILPSGLIKIKLHTVKPVLRGHSKRRPKLVFKTDHRLMQVKSIEECSKGSILQYLRPSLSYHLSLISWFCLFLSGRLRQVLLYIARGHGL